ncbi:MAG: hypothetical protein CL669_02615 [Balneola sp.]|nr:hypothetical protein [Balneola sp.]
MNISTINKTMLSFALVVSSFGFITQSQAQYTLYGDNIVINGDFSAADSSWEPNGDRGTASFDAGNLDIVVNTSGNMWEFQVYQILSETQIAALAEGGDWELSFDAASPDGAKTFHVFLGENGGSWSRYWAADGDGLVTVDGDMKTYTLNTNVKEVWTSGMKLGFEVAADDADLVIDNIALRTKKSSVVFNGDFSLVDSASGAPQGFSGGVVQNGEMAFLDIPGEGNQWEVQSMQVLTQEQKDSIYAPGPYELSFDAYTDEGTNDIHVYFGERGGGWERYFGNEFGDGKLTLDTEKKKYILETPINKVWGDMQVGFEVNFQAGNIFIDNLAITRITEIPPAAPEVAVATENGIVSIGVSDAGAATYEVYFADSAFTDYTGGALIATLDATTGLTATHSVPAPHASMVKTFDAYYGVIGRTAKGTPGPMTAAMINTPTSVAPNYIYELSAAAVEAAAGALESGVVPPATALASFFPDDYKPFTIDSNSLTVEGNAPEGGDADASAKFWVGFENITGANMMVFYAEMTDDVIVPAAASDNGGGGWDYDSWEAGIGAYSPDFIVGSDHQSFEAGDEPDYQLRAGLMDVNGPYIHGWDGGSGSGDFNQLVGNSATIADTSTAGVVRLLTILSTIEFSGVNTESDNFEFPTGEGVSTMMFNLAINDNDATGRDYQGCWSSKCTGQWWNTPANWEVVALVGSAAVVSNEDEVASTPLEYSLDQNYPNPFNPSTNIQFTLAATSNVTLEVYNMLGQKVATLLQGQKMNAGNHTQVFDASRFASGMYVYRISTPNFVQSRTMMLIK